MNNISLPTVIIGGGIAGLWLFHRLHKLGHQALLLEKHVLGGSQSMQSQGIIHGGIKYALNGLLTPSANAIAGMPARWQSAMQNAEEVDLKSIIPLSEHHYMFTGKALGSKLTSFFASKAVRGRMEKASSTNTPDIFKHSLFSGDVYALNEWVLDIEQVTKALVTPYQDFALKIDEVDLIDHGSEIQIEIKHNHNQFKISAKNIILTAGEGTEALVKNLDKGVSWPNMQRRPLHMIAVKGQLPGLFGHCLGSGSKPLFTVTTLSSDDGDNVWSIGGDLAENGIDWSPEKQIEHAKNVIQKNLPWIDFTSTQWRTWHVNRAEPAQKSLIRPDTAFSFKKKNLTVCWPTKLALAPDLSDQIIELNQLNQPTPDFNLPDLPVAPIAKPYWQHLFN